jgi:hypothetical protein
MTLSGASTFSNYQNTIDLVRFSDSGDNPTDYGTHTSRTIARSVSEGLLSSDEQTTTITVVGVNDAPAIASNVTFNPATGDTSGLSESNAALQGWLTTTRLDHSRPCRRISPKTSIRAAKPSIISASVKA